METTNNFITGQSIVLIDQKTIINQIQVADEQSA